MSLHIRGPIFFGNSLNSLYIFKFKYFFKINVLNKKYIPLHLCLNVEGRSKKTSFTLTTLTSNRHVSSATNLALEFFTRDHFDKCVKCLMCMFFFFNFVLLTLVVNHLVLQGLCLFGVLIGKATSL